jgi:hypothetical protein
VVDLYGTTIVDGQLASGLVAAAVVGLRAFFACGALGNGVGSAEDDRACRKHCSLLGRSVWCRHTRYFTLDSNFAARLISQQVSLTLLDSGVAVESPAGAGSVQYVAVVNDLVYTELTDDNGGLGKEIERGFYTLCEIEL